MFYKTSKALGMIEVFAENTYTPYSVLIEIASSPTMQLVQHAVARSAKEILQSRADLRESSDDFVIKGCNHGIIYLPMRVKRQHLQFQQQ